MRGLIILAAGIAGAALGVKAAGVFIIFGALLALVELSDPVVDDDDPII